MIYFQRHTLWPPTSSTAGDINGEKKPTLDSALVQIVAELKVAVAGGEVLGKSLQKNETR